MKIIGETSRVSSKGAVQNAMASGGKPSLEGVLPTRRNTQSCRVRAHVAGCGSCRSRWRGLAGLPAWRERSACTAWA